MSIMFDNASGKYVLLDGSYCMHHACYATWAWYRVQNFTNIVGNVNEHDFTKDEDYMGFFQVNFRNKLNDIYSRNVIPMTNLIIALDCPKTQIWRQDIFNEYKLARILKVKKETEPNFKTVMKWTADVLYPAMKEQFNFKMIKVDRCEADDIIAVLTQKLTSEGNICVICANDHDYHQLISDRVTVEDFGGNNWNINNTNPGLSLLTKVIGGDRGDGVAAIHPRCGKVCTEKYIADKNLLVEKLTSEPEVMAQYQLNKKLVSFNEIPMYIRENILTAWNSND